MHSKIVEWLTNSEIRRDDGAILSWINPQKPGYVYPEIIGYYIRFCAWLAEKEGKYSELASSSADYLSRNLSKSGAAFRDDIEYVFDSAMCLAGLMSLEKRGLLKEEHAVAAKRLAEFVRKNSTARVAAVRNGEAILDKTRWSLSYGSLLIKCCIGLYEYTEYSGDKTYKEIAKKMVNELIEKTWRKDHFSINEFQEWVYTHPHCYATEGLIYLQEKGEKNYDNIIESSAKWLAENQNEDGSMNSWYYRDVVKDKQGDASAQAVRIWLCVDRKRYKTNVKKGLAFLQTLVEDGLYYNQGSKDKNSWVSMFATQAFYWEAHNTQPEWLV